MVSSLDALGERLFALCAADTTTGQEDRGLPVVREQLRELGADVHLQEVAPGRTNVLATWSDPAQARVLFSTHLDTVPPYLPPRFEGHTLFGRGSCDAKGQIVAHFAAIQALLARGETRLAWLGVVAEETDSSGAQAALQLAPRLPGLVVVIDGEPTDNVLATGQRGVAQLHLECQGVAAHSGMPETGHSAILDLLDWLQRVRAQPTRSDPELGDEVCNVGVISGGAAANVVPAHAEALLLARTVPESDFVARVLAAAPPRGTVNKKGVTPADRYPAVPGFPRAVVPFGSDAPRLRALAKDRTVALVGPGSIRVAHTDHEHLPLTALAEGIDLLVRLANHFLRS